MIVLLRFTALALAILAMITWARAASQVEMQPTAAGTVQPRLTVLYDAFGDASHMHKDWGYSALVEIGGKRILFDTGNDPAVFARNVKAKGVDLTSIDFVVMSHRHGDHMGGLSHVLAVNPKVKIYAPKEGFGVYGASLPSSFYRKDDALPPNMRYFDGAPPEVMTFGSAWPDANFELIDKTTEIAPGLHLIALVSDKPGTMELKELSLAIESPEGIVLIVGCSHPGIDKIVAAASAINKRIHMIAGGMHLVVAKDAEIGAIATLLHETYAVQWIAPGHCTGEPAFAALKKAFGDRYLYAGAGMALGLGAKPRAGLGTSRTFAMSDEDLRDYRDIRRRSLVSFGRPAKSMGGAN